MPQPKSDLELKKDTIQKEILIWNRRLQLLKERLAKVGLSSDPSLNIEIEDIEVKTAELYTQLEQLQDDKEHNKNSKHHIRCHNLPRPEYEYFVGRKAELEQIRHLLSPKHRSWVVTIDGIGGIGKSTLALEVADSYRRYHDKLPKEERFDAIVWTSAQRNILTVEGIVPRQNPVSTLDAILRTIATVLLGVTFTTQPDNLIDLVNRLLTEYRTLIIIDNLETIDDKAVMDFLHELPDPTKAIVTTRHRLNIAYPIRLVGMSEEDTHKLIAQECQKKLVTLNEFDVQRLYKRTGGVPLAIVWSVSLIAFGFSVETVLKRLGKPNDDISRYCFEEVMINIRGSLAYNLLAALALSKTDATRDELGYVAGIQDDKLSRDEELVQLEKLSLVHRTGYKFSILPLVKQFVLEDLTSNPELENLLVERWVIPKTLFIDESTYDVWVEGQIIRLTPTEFELLLYLYNHVGQLCRGSDIAKHVFGYEDVTDRLYEMRLNSTMKRLREKIEPDPGNPKYIVTIRGMGYKLTID